VSIETDRMAGVNRILAAARAALGMDLSFITRLEDDAQRISYVSDDADAASFGWSPGVAIPARDGYCHYVIAGQLPGLLPDTAANPIAAGLPVTTGAGIGSYAGVPLRLPDGRVYGALCAVSHEARPLRTVDEELLRVLAALVADELTRLEQQDAARLQDVAEFQSLFAPGAVTVVTQPIVDLRDGRVVGMEALARFTAHPEGPAAVFASAEALGLGVDLELAAVTAALAVLPDVPAPLYLSVNVSPAAVLDPRLGHLLCGTEAGRVVLELTEHAAVEDYPHLVERLRSVSAAGFRFAVDDAGAGFASLRHILDLGPDVIKLDIALIRGIDTDPARRALARALVLFADELGAVLIAEGIETQTELATLQGLGVTHGQGYHLGRPASPATHDLSAVAVQPNRRPVSCS
jgi:EAL domain-containing protein (putative c-di-GMP-specific phosphodiesterase class I)